MNLLKAKLKTRPVWTQALKSQNGKHSKVLVMVGVDRLGHDSSHDRLSMDKITLVTLCSSSLTEKCNGKLRGTEIRSKKSSQRNLLLSLEIPQQQANKGNSLIHFEVKFCHAKSINKPWVKWRCSIRAPHRFTVMTQIFRIVIQIKERLACNYVGGYLYYDSCCEVHLGLVINPCHKLKSPVHWTDSANNIFFLHRWGLNLRRRSRLVLPPFDGTLLLSFLVDNTWTAQPCPVPLTLNILFFLLYLGTHPSHNAAMTSSKLALSNQVN